MNKSFPLLVILWPAIACAQQSTDPPLRPLDLEDLMKVEVTTASKSGQSISDVPAAIYVISQEDIRRSGAMNIPEALRLAPGVDVSQIDGNKWMISIRGFNSKYADKLLVLVDGKSVYTSLFSGVYWDALDLPLSDIDRIEVIRGPGGSLWGANAINGVINIITKNSAHTQGSLISTEVGSDEKLNSTYRYGGKFSKDATYRVYSTYSDRGPLSQFPKPSGPDLSSSTGAGFRIDAGQDLGDKFMIKGDVQSEHLGQRTTDPSFHPPFANVTDIFFPASEWSTVARWERNSASGASQTLQAYFDHSERLGPELFEKSSTIDLDYQRRFATTGKHTFTLGAGFRQTGDSTGGPDSLDILTPAAFTQNVYSAFVHDTMDLKPHWKLLMGSKFEHNPFTGLEIQPNAQLLFTPAPDKTYWASVSRAVRTPSRIERGADIDTLVVPGPEPTLVTLLGSPNFKSIDVIALESGARFGLSNNTFLDVAAFYNRYTNLRTFEPGSPYLDSGLPVQPLILSNKLSADTAGIEAAIKIKPRPWWNLSASYSLYSEKLTLASDSQDNTRMGDGRGGAPNHMFQIHSYMDIGSHFEFDNDLYYTSALINGVPAYLKFDARLGWSPNSSLDLSLGVRNAFSANHTEAGEATFETVGQVPRSVYFRATWRF
jgi:iron complex outermembrane receptor protein